MVCIESIPAYAGVVVRGCHFWCMSGVMALLQGSCSQIIVFNGRGGGVGVFI